MDSVLKNKFSALETFRPFSDMDLKRKDMERIWGRMACDHHHSANYNSVSEWLPSVELSETRDNLIIKAELPSLKEKDIEVFLSGDILTIKGEKKQEKREDKEKEHYHYSETYYGSFQRSFRLPVGVKADSIDACFDKGVLKITLPKTEEGRKKEIKIKVK